MIPAGVQVFVALEPVDMRFGFERLAGLVRERLGHEARCGALFVFLGKRRKRATQCVPPSKAGEAERFRILQF